MLIPLATFAVAFVTIVGSYWLFVVRLEQQEKGALVERLKTYRPRFSRVTVVSDDKPASQIQFLDELLKNRSVIVGPLSRLLEQSGLDWTVGALLLMVAVGALGGALAGWLLLHRAAVAALLCAIGAGAPWAVVLIKRSKRLRLMEDQFPEAIDLVARALRSGHAFTTGLGMVAEEVKPPIGAEFQRVYDEQNFGMSLPDALRGMAARVPLLDTRFFVTAVLTQRESGGNLAEVLDNLSRVIRERFKLKRQIQVISAHGRITAWVLAWWPPVLALLLWLINPDMMNSFVEDPLGPALAIAALALQVLGVMVIMRMVRVEY